VFNGLTACSPRGARRVHFDPVDPNTVYATFGAKGIWRSNSNGDPGSWVQIFAPRGGSTSPATGADVERAEFDVVALPDGATRMYGRGKRQRQTPSSSGATASVPVSRRSRS
jgi:hypothetical protein